MTTIYGASDDLIEIEGDVEDEVNKIEPKNLSVKCSDGTEAKITYDEEGQWKIVVNKRGDLLAEHVLSVGDDAEHTREEIKRCSGYSDVLLFKDGLEWVKIGGKTFKA